ncbi:hypothetical protein DFP72DRAFT_436442 [Ephemerocybe angulata]|uniref:Nephrocystin 3-like N-terminal domain-containing protein n=1 Tax=Ephemerocybe angulata TaxID=980116 RepID=A0A8H6HTU7_9AGAR|nr:hypothetical protein DFP72DRAFT_436442 [Tulosesus angulatus]
MLTTTSRWPTPYNRSRPTTPRSTPSYPSCAKTCLSQNCEGNPSLPTASSTTSSLGQVLLPANGPVGAGSRATARTTQSRLPVFKKPVPHVLPSLLPPSTTSHKPQKPQQQGASFFSHAQNFHLETLVYNEAPRAGIQGPLQCAEQGWDQLVEHTAPNALLNSSARFDAPKCDKDTRVEVIREVKTWIMDRTTPTKLLCITGAAGAGKSALQQTIAEQCRSENILASTYFFWSGDPTRNTVSGFVPTIAYQLGLKNPVLRRILGAVVYRDPLIFQQSLSTQINALIIEPVTTFKLVEGEEAERTLPYAIFIDGLDECKDARRQVELLQAIETAILDQANSPFRLVIASRPEWPIRNALMGPLGNKAYHVPLSDKYDASGDIRRFLWRTLREIGLRRGNPRAHPSIWPTAEDIEWLVAAASGQFIYATTVVKYISERLGSPVDRLKIVLKWKPALEQRAAPFAALDALYTNILSTAMAAYEAVDTNDPEEFLPLLAAYRALCTYVSPMTMELVDSILGNPENAHAIVISDLRSVVHANEVGDLQFYHKSFEDFLDSKLRAKELYVSPERVAAFVICRILNKICQTEWQDELDSGRRLTIVALCETLARYPPDDPEIATERRGTLSPLLASFTRLGGFSCLQDYHDSICVSRASTSDINCAASASREDAFEWACSSEEHLFRLGENLGILAFEEIIPSLTEMTSVDFEVYTAMQIWLCSLGNKLMARARRGYVTVTNRRHLERLRADLHPSPRAYDPQWWGMIAEVYDSLRNLMGPGPSSENCFIFLRQLQCR